MTSLRNALIWSFAERYSSLLITISSTLILARILTPTQIGIFSLCAAVTAVAGILRDFGVSEYIIQEKDLTREKLKAALGTAVLVAWPIGVIVFSTKGLIAGYYQEQGLEEVLAVLSLSFLILPFASPAFALLTRDMAFQKIFAVQTTSNAVQSLTAVVLAYRGLGYMSLAWAPVMGLLVQAAMLVFLRPSGTLLLPRLTGARAVLRYGSMFAVSRLIETFARNAHEFALARQFGFASVGLFSRALGLIELFQTNVASAILRVATPSFASDHRAGVRLADNFARGTAIFTAIAWPFFGFVALMSADIVRLLFGPQWDAAAPIAAVLALATLPSYLYALGPTILAATGHVKRRLKIALVFSPVHLAGVFFASFISMQAVATVWFASNLLMVALYTYHLRQVLHARLRELFAPSLGSLVVAGASVLAQGLALAAWHVLEAPPMARLAMVATAGAVSWLLTARAVGHPVYVELVRFLARGRSNL